MLHETRINPLALAQFQAGCSAASAVIAYGGDPSTGHGRDWRTYVRRNWPGDPGNRAWWLGFARTARLADFSL
jgi:hypothetical protein